MKDDEKTLEGITRYALGAVKELKRLNTRLKAIQHAGNSDAQIRYKFQVLRDIRTYTSSYGQFISEINDALAEDDLEYQQMSQTEKDNDLLEWLKDDITIYEADGSEQTINMKTLIAELNQMSLDLNSKFRKIGLPLFCEYMKPFLPEGFVDKNGNKITVKDLMESATDITWLDKWLDPMSDSSNLMLQLIDARVKDANTKARLETIDLLREEQALMKEFEDAGIKDYKWMFEMDRNGDKSGNFISAINFAEYNLDKRMELQRLHQKYGEKLKGDDAKTFKIELKEWRKIHCMNEFSDIPNSSMYRNEAFDRLKNDTKRYDLYKKYIALKKKIDAKLGLDINPFMAIQKRKDSM